MKIESLRLGQSDKVFELYFLHTRPMKFVPQIALLEIYQCVGMSKVL
jgi:hypothetical protein